jgi:hypothetical protein
MSRPKHRKKRRAASKRGAARSKTAKKAAKGGTALVPRPSTTIDQPTPEEEAAYAETLIESGQAARPNKEGKLPAGATHIIVDDKETGKIKVVRRRFSIT